MPWRTIHGVEVEHPWAASGKPPSMWTDRDKEWVGHYTHLHQQTVRLDSELAQAKAEIARLTAENNFMLRLINGALNKEKLA